MTPDTLQDDIAAANTKRVREEEQQDGCATKSLRPLDDTIHEVAQNTLAANEEALNQTLDILHSPEMPSADAPPTQPVNIGNIAHFIKWGMEKHSHEALQASIKFIENEINLLALLSGLYSSPFSYTFNDGSSSGSCQGVFRILFNTNVNKDVIDKLNTILAPIKAASGNFKIEISVIICKDNAEALSGLIDKNGAFIASIISNDPDAFDLNEIGLADLLAKTINLNFLSITSASIDEDHPIFLAINQLAKLETLEFYALEKITAMPNLSGLEQLKFLRLHNCNLLSDVTAIKTLTTLTKLEISNCAHVVDLSVIEELKELVELYIINIPDLLTPPTLTDLTNLKILKIKNCQSMTNPPLVNHLKDLEKFDLSECYGMTSYPDISQLQRLKCLKMPEIQSKDRFINFKVHEAIQRQKNKLCLDAIEINPDLYFQVKRGLIISNTASIQKKLLEKGIWNFLNNLDQFEYLAPSVCLTAIYELAEMWPQADVSEILYDLILAIDTMPKGLSEAVAEMDEIKHFLSANGLESAINQCIPLYMLDKFAERNEAGADYVDDFVNYIEKENDFKTAPFHLLRNSERIKFFFEANQMGILSNEQLTDIFIKIYPPDDITYKNYFPIITEITETKIYNNYIKQKHKTVKMYCHMDSATQNTSEALNKFSEALAGLELPSLFRVKFYGNIAEGIGLSATFISHLFGAVVGNKTNIRFYEFNGSTFQKLPSLSDSGWDEEVLKEYASFGKILGFLLQAKENYPIGEVLHKYFFKTLLMFSNEEMNLSTAEYQKALMQMPAKKYLKKCLHLFDIEHLKSLVKVNKILLNKQFEELTEKDISKIHKLLSFEGTITEHNYERLKKALLMKSADAVKYKLIKQLIKTLDFNTLEDDMQDEFKKLCADLWIDFKVNNTLPSSEASSSTSSQDVSDDNLSTNFTDAKNELIREVLRTRFNTLSGMHAIARGLIQSFPLRMTTSWGNETRVHHITGLKELQQIGKKKLNIWTQGILTKEDFKNALHSKNPHVIINWLNEWVDDESTTIENLRAVLRMITGAPVIPFNKMLHIDILPIPKITFRTCIRTLEVWDEITKEALVEELNNCLDDPGNFDFI
jgi:hypothetical protein